MPLHEQRRNRFVSLGLPLLTCFVLALSAASARADLPQEDRRKVERRVIIENQADFAGWKIFAYPYNFSAGAPRLGLASFDPIGLTPPRFVSAHVFALPPGKNVELPEGLEDEAGLERLKKAGAVDSGVVLGPPESLPSDSKIESVREVLRIRELTPVSFKLERVALEYQLEGDVAERVECSTAGACGGPAGEPNPSLGLTRQANPTLDSPPAASEAPSPTPAAPESPEAQSAAKPARAPDPEPPLSPLVWFALAAVVVGVGLFALRGRKTDLDPPPR